MTISETIAMFRKEVALEWRQKFAFSGVLLYLVSAVFVSYLAFEGLIPAATWNVLFWIILLFASINGIVKSFFQERDGRMLYYYSICSPLDIIFSKILYNALLMCCLSAVGFLVYISLMGNLVESTGVFLLNMLLGVIGFSSIMSMVSAIASKAGNNFTLMAVLSFPLVLPLLVVLIRVSGAAMYGTSLAEQGGHLLVIILLTGISGALSALLFPYIWRD